MSTIRPHSLSILYFIAHCTNSFGYLHVIVWEDFEAGLCITVPTFLCYEPRSTSSVMASASGPPVGEVATSCSSSAAINILLPHRRACCACSCKCGCKCCLCRCQIETIDPNREEYGGEGTLLGAGTNAITQVTSFTSTGSMDSVRESSDAPAPTSTAPTSFDTIRGFYGQQDPARLAESKMAYYLNEVDDDRPWESFLEKSVTSDAMDEDAGFFGPVELDGSMQNNAPLSSGRSRRCRASHLRSHSARRA